MNQASSPLFSSEPIAFLARARSRMPGRGNIDHVLIGQVVIIAIFIASLVLLDGMSRSHAQLTLSMNSGQRAFEGTAPSGMTLLDALNASAIAGNIKFRFMIDNASRAVILSLGEYEADAGHLFSVSINGKIIPVESIHAAPVHPGDVIYVEID